MMSTRSEDGLCDPEIGFTSMFSRTWPILSLSDLGGVAGVVARWIRLCEQHPRAASPAVSPHRLGVSTGETELLTLAAAFENWVAVHRHNRVRWADRPAKPRGTSGHEFMMQCLANRAAGSFVDFVGNDTRWSADFSTSGNRLKHDPSAVIDFGHHAYNSLRSRLRDRYT